MSSIQKNQFSSSILYDIYGNPNGEPILVLEDIFYPHCSSELENLYFGNFNILHFKRIQWEEFSFEQESLLENILGRLEELILLQNKPCTILAEGYSSGLALHLAQENPSKVSGIHLLSPIYISKMESDMWDYLKEFWDWYTKEKEAIRYFYKLPYLMNLFLKNLSLIQIMFTNATNLRVHFWLPISFSLENSLKLQTKFLQSEVNRIDKCYERLSLHNITFQKILAWKKQAAYNCSRLDSNQ